MKKMGSREELCFNGQIFRHVRIVILAKNDMAYRVRKEGCRWVAALKWNGHSEGALHTREEINVPVE